MTTAFPTARSAATVPAWVCGVRDISAAACASSGTPHIDNTGFLGDRTRIDAFGRVDTVPDEDQWAVFGFRTLGRSASAGLRATF